MQEESSMDKKVAVKTNGSSDASNKYQQEFGANKSNRQPKRKDNGYGRGNEVRRGSKNRPYPRGDYYTDRSRVYPRGDFCPDKSRQVKEVLPDVKTKKQNLNHLLNFTIAPRHSDEYSAPPVRRIAAFNRRPKYNKEQYLQANCQFVVRADGDYSVHSADPDLLVEWDLVEQVRLHSNEIPSCPICLYPPVASKITRCGHIFCSCCILHYLALSDKLSRKCPICYESVTRKDLKSVLSITHPQLSVGNNITFCLMRRERGSMIAVPVEHYSRGIAQNLPSLEKQLPTTAYSKLLLATPSQVISCIIDKERQELEVQLKDEKEAPESCFIQQALELLNERKQALEDGERRKIPELPLIYSMEKLEVVAEDRSKAKTVVTYECAFDDVTCSPIDEEPPRERLVSEESLNQEESCASALSDSAQATEPEVTSEDLDISKLQKTVNQPKPTFYFYQAVDGQLVFLHALNVHMLVAEYGSLDRCPRILTGKAIELEGTSMTESLRSKLRYLSHLSVTTNFQVAEIQLKPPQVKTSVLDMFHGEIEKRKKIRARRARSEKKREKRIYDEERKKWGMYPSNTRNIDSHYHFPQSVAATAHRQEKESAVETEASLPQEANAPKSFAQMLRDGKNKHSSIVPSESASADAERTRKDTSESEVEDWNQPPEYQQSFSDAIQRAINNIKETEEVVPAEEGGKKKKKKKNKQQLLFSTSMFRGK